VFKVFIRAEMETSAVLARGITCGLVAATKEAVEQLPAKLNANQHSARLLEQLLLAWKCAVTNLH
jgi:hypothetical protein